MIPDKAEDDVNSLITRVHTQQEKIEYLTKHIARVEAKLDGRISAVEKDLRSKSKPTDGSADTHIDRQALSEFVDFMVVNHGLHAHIRPCWYEHQAAVWELAALMGGWGVAFAVTADKSMPSWWQDLLERSQKRLRGMFVSCRVGHIANADVPWMSEDDRARRARWIRNDLPGPTA